MFDETKNFGSILNKKIQNYNKQLNSLNSSFRDPNISGQSIRVFLSFCVNSLSEIGRNAMQDELFVNNNYSDFNHEINDLSIKIERFKDLFKENPHEISLLSEIEEIFNTLPRLAPPPAPAPIINPPTPITSPDEIPESMKTAGMRYTSYALIGTGFFASLGGAGMAAKSIGEYALKETTNEAAKMAAREALREGMVKGVTVAAGGMVAGKVGYNLTQKKK